MLSTPVVFIVFNRPDLTRITFERIRAVQPSDLYVIADGPRPDRPADRALCESTRAVVEEVDWPCEVVRDYSDVNLGCKRRVSGGLDAAFERHDRAIVIEDDVLADPTFFYFAETMLRRYADRPDVMMVSGFNPLGSYDAASGDHLFSYCGSIWGWASWRRCWRHYDVTMRRWADPAVRAEVIARFGDDDIAGPRVAAYDRTLTGAVDTWDFQWSFARIAAGGMSVVPRINLVQNIGFRDDATHTRRASSISAVQVGRWGGAWGEPPTSVDREYDRAFTRTVVGPTPAAKVKRPVDDVQSTTPESHGR
jgi:hypothetical protein